MSATLYVETSALLAWVFGEAATVITKNAIDRAHTTVTSSLTLLEVERVLARHRAQGGMKEAEHKKVLGVVKRLMAPWLLMEISRSVRQRAGERFPVEPIRALDAIHLATALEFAEAYPDLEILSFDDRICDNLSGLGLTAAARSISDQGAV